METTVTTPSVSTPSRVGRPRRPKVEIIRDSTDSLPPPPPPPATAGASDEDGNYDEIHATRISSDDSYTEVGTTSSSGQQQDYDGVMQPNTEGALSAVGASPPKGQIHEKQWPQHPAVTHQLRGSQEEDASVLDAVAFEIRNSLGSTNEPPMAYPVLGCLSARRIYEDDLERLSGDACDCNLEELAVLVASGLSNDYGGHIFQKGNSQSFSFADACTGYGKFTCTEQCLNVHRDGIDSTMLDLVYSELLSSKSIRWSSVLHKLNRKHLKPENGHHKTTGGECLLRYNLSVSRLIDTWITCTATKTATTGAERIQTEKQVGVKSFSDAFCSELRKPRFYLSSLVNIQKSGVSLSNSSRTEVEIEPAKRKVKGFGQNYESPYSQHKIGTSEATRKLHFHTMPTKFQ